MDLEALKKSCMECDKCALCETRHNVVFATGTESAEVMLIGEGPGEQEDKRGTPFVGRAGELLDTMLQIIDLDRDKIYITNIVKCRPPRNRDPLAMEKDACMPWLREQIRLINPKIIICLGRVAATSLIREDFKITREHGQWTEKNGVMMTAIYHPAALLRDTTKRPETFVDLKEIQRLIKETCTRTF